ncbi:MAG: Rne/Rng family ribonuclease [Atribacterota bacterium]|nr:Rne/Rng family ribonuclease [Atribacterota bacterium]MDD3031672.1 Rne/Rng family ribonuclease [Atribacterota bacterium]MDD3640342.1 Rne/Rng family ribonuclease [Atribacterota bacterium]MDD4288149.1 Rne/Rng family ribonuclease [Atribacterota bacterium]MDI9596010.1 Rne/Rng family ribonuclease [Atribacterota bacterium]
MEIKGKQVIIDSGLSEERVAILENNKLVEIHIERLEDRKIIGNIYKGKVKNVLPGIEAAFIDIGIDRNAFLHLNDLEQSGTTNNDKKIDVNELIKVGQEIDVQVVKEAIVPKGARVTTDISLPGRYLVLMPNNKGIAVSRRIEQDEEKDRLKKIVQKIKHKDFGFIVRTAGIGKNEEDFAPDMDLLVRLWTKIQKRSKKAKAPMLLHEDLNLTYRVIRDLFTEDIDEFVVNTKKDYQKIVSFLDTLSLLDLKPRVSYYNGDKPIFEEYNIEKEINRALEKKVWIKCGGYLVFDEVEALTVIDVNTGKYVGGKKMKNTILKTNMQAAEEIARQLRLRDIGGIIIIDFIDMDNKEDQEKVMKKLEDALKKDKTKTNIVQTSELGLVEMTRKRSKRDLDSLLRTSCPYCSGNGRVFSIETVSNQVMHKLEDLSIHSKAEAILLGVHPKVEEELAGSKMMLIKQLEKDYRKSIYIKPLSDLHIEKIKVIAVGRKKEVKKIVKIL